MRDKTLDSLRAALDEDEAVAKACGEDHICPDARSGRWQVVGDRHVRYDNGAGEILRSVDVTGRSCMWYEQIRVAGDPDGHVAAHIARHDPARVLAVTAAIRAIIAESEGEGRGWDECEPAYYAGVQFAVLALAEALTAATASPAGHPPAST